MYCGGLEEEEREVESGDSPLDRRLMVVVSSQEKHTGLQAYRGEIDPKVPDEESSGGGKIHNEEKERVSPQHHQEKKKLFKGKDL